MRATKYFGSLESLRGVAALLVAAYHADWINVWAVRNGYLMVDFFFVLSGFVICHTYATRILDGFSFSQFVFTRIGRLYPLHLAMLLAWVGIECLKWYAQAKGMNPEVPAFSRNDGGALLGNLLLVHSFGFSSMTFNGPSWSIGAEFYVYLLFGALLLAVRRHRAAVFLALSVTALGLLLYLGETELSANARYGAIRCVYGFFLGAAAYLAFAKPPRVISPSLVLLLTSCILLGKDAKTLSDFLMPPLFCWLIVSVAYGHDSFAGRLLNAKPLRWLGEVSYSIYMTHFALAWVFKQIISFALPGHGAILMAVYLSTVLLVSNYTFRWIERPFRERAKAIAKSWEVAHA